MNRLQQMSYQIVSVIRFLSSLPTKSTRLWHPVLSCRNYWNVVPNEIRFFYFLKLKLYKWQVANSEKHHHFSSRYLKTTTSATYPYNSNPKLDSSWRTVGISLSPTPGNTPFLKWHHLMEFFCHIAKTNFSCVTHHKKPLSSLLPSYSKQIKRNQEYLSYRQLVSIHTCHVHWIVWILERFLWEGWLRRNSSSRIVHR